MVFVHARNATVKTAMSLRDLATNYGDLSYFQPEQSPRLGQAEKQVSVCVHVLNAIYKTPCRFSCRIGLHIGYSVIVALTGLHIG